MELVLIKHQKLTFWWSSGQESALQRRGSIPGQRPKIPQAWKKGKKGCIHLKEVKKLRYVNFLYFKVGFPNSFFIAVIHIENVSQFIYSSNRHSGSLKFLQ